MRFPLLLLLSACAFIGDDHAKWRDDVDADGVPNEEDCAPEDASIGTGSTFYADADADGYGSTIGTSACSAPAGHVDNATDCDDAAATVHPDAPETCNQLDDDCDGDIDEDASNGTLWFYDGDGDGYGNAGITDTGCEAPEGYVAEDTDCADGVSAIHPDAAETCNGLDDDCDGDIDDDASDAATWYLDDDGDGFGSTVATSACAPPDGHVDNADDCDDADAAYNPGAAEPECADPNDYNCDGSTGRDDLDADGWAACEECDDGDAGVHPGAVEVCNGVDDDCDGDADGAATDALEWYEDADGDGYGSAVTRACDVPLGHVAVDGDCDDGAVAINPAATERCDGLDNDCDGSTDGVDATDTTSWYTDADGDGFGAGSGTSACDAPAGSVADATDCDDASASDHPGATEVVDDGDDEDCDGFDACYLDADEDGDGTAAVIAGADLDCDDAGESGTAADCDDGDAGVHSYATEVCNGVDDDCDGDADGGAVDALAWYADADGDTYGSSVTSTACDAPVGYVAVDGDCDDASSAVSPLGTEICDGVDNDCDGSVDEGVTTTWYLDADGDGYGSSTTSAACSAPPTYVATATDCDDTDATVNPAATEVSDDRVDNDCDGVIDDCTTTGTEAWSEDFDRYTTSSFSGTDGWVSGYSLDPWATYWTGGVYATTDDTPGTWGSGEAVDNHLVYTGDAWSDFTLEANLYTYDDDTIGLVFRYQDASNYYLFLLTGGGQAPGAGAGTSTIPGAGARLYVVSGGSATLLASSTTTYIVGATHDAKVVVSGSGIDVYFDADYSGIYSAAEHIFSVTDSTFSDGNVGLYCFNNGDLYYCRFDDVVVSYPDSDGDGIRDACEGDSDGDGYNATVVGGDDCDDTDATVNPGQVEVCDNGVDDDCDDSAGACGPSDRSLADADAQYTGEAADDWAGFSVSTAGDVDGDGFDDLIVGAPYNDAGGSLAGAAYLFRGSASSGDLTLGDADAVYTGEVAHAYAGCAVSSAGDVDGDGLADIVVGAFGNDDGGYSAGAAYLVLGAASPGDLNLADADAQYTGEATDDFAGYSVSAANDVNGDGFGDLIVGACGNDDGGFYAGAAYLVLGSATPGNLNLMAADAQYTGEATTDHAGCSVSAAGDVDGDGSADLIVGAYGNNDGGTYAGAAYLILGSEFPGDLGLGAADARYIGEAASDYSGYSVSTAGDVDGDGFADLIIGAPYSDDAGMSAGAAYVVLGSAPPGGGGLAAAGVRYIGEATGDLAGWSVSTAGDVDCDGFDDVIVGAIGNDDGGTGAGAAYLVLGSASPGAFDLGRAHARYTGETTGDQAGYSVSAAGDLDGDGFGDILVGANGNDDGGSYAGAVYLILGGGL